MKATDKGEAVYMDMIVLKEIPFELDKELIIKKLHITEEEDKDRIGTLANEALSIGKPKGIYVETYIDHKDEESVSVGIVTFESRVLRINLDNIFKIYPYSATCGTELEEWADSIGDVLENFWADTIKQMVLGTAVNYLKKHVKDKYGFRKISTMNPGSLEDWPLSEQGKLFELLGDTRQEIGVRLTESFLMLPTKSVSGIIFPVQKGFENCQLCKRKGCPGRSAPFDEVLFREKYGLEVE
jgi:hypothetical protein